LIVGILDPTQIAVPTPPDGGVAFYSNNGSAFVFNQAFTGISGSQSKLGWSVAMSGDGSTAFGGAPTGLSGLGQVFAYTLDSTGTTWVAVPTSLTAITGVSSVSNQGSSVATNFTGNVVAVGARLDQLDVGCVGMYLRVISGGDWLFQGNKLVGTGYITGAILGVEQGASAALNRTGSTLVEGGPGDNLLNGATWVFV
jgi:hypothetical protein